MYFNLLGLVGFVKSFLYKDKYGGRNIEYYLYSLSCLFIIFIRVVDFIVCSKWNNRRGFNFIIYFEVYLRFRYILKIW